MWKVWGPDRLWCTWCLISQAVAVKLGIQVREMAKPVKFEQVDDSLS